MEAITSVMLNGENGEAYNIGSQYEITNLELVNIICELLDELIPRDFKKYSELIKFVKDRPGHDIRYGLNTSKIRTLTSWTPKIKFIHGIKDSLKWMIDNRDWLSNKSNQVDRLGLNIYKK